MLETIQDSFSRLDTKIASLRTQTSENEVKNYKHVDYETQLSSISATINAAREELINKCRFYQEQANRNFSYFIGSNQNLKGCGLAGRLSIQHDLISRIQFLKFWPNQNTVSLPRSRLVRNISSRKSHISPDMILPCLTQHIIYAHTVESKSFVLEIRNGQSKCEELVCKTEIMNQPSQLVFCRANYDLDRIILYLEKW